MTLDLSRYPQPGDVLIGGRTVGADLILPTQRPVVVGTPEWWLRRLIARLVARAETCREFSDFYDGHQPLAFASSKFVEHYGRRFRRFPANLMPLVVEAEAERLIIDGFRFGARPESDRGVWRIWQDNQLDAESQIAHEIALTKGIAYAAVDPFAETPTVTIEDPTETIVETAPGNRRTRLAALKVFIDDDGYSRAYLYLPDMIHRFRSAQRRTDTTAYGLSQARWQPLTEGDEEPSVANRLGVVPIVPLINRPRRDGSGRSEIEPVMGNQLAINFLRYAALIGSDGAALPQRWAKNLDLQIDPDTGQAQRPFAIGADLWATRRPTPDEIAEYADKMPEVEFGQFPGASLQPFVNLIEEEMGLLASASGTPYHYFLGKPTSVPPTGESIKSSEAKLVKKVQRQTIHFGEGWEETMRVALLAAGQRGKAARSTAAETMWRDAETRNEGARTDAILKQYQAGLLPDEFALEELGYSQQQIERIGEMRGSDRVNEAELPRLVEAAGVLIRSGFAPEDALRTVGLDPIRHLGLVPVTVQRPPTAPPTAPTGAA